MRGDGEGREAAAGGSLLFVVMNPMHMNKVRWWCAEFDLDRRGRSDLPGLGHDQAGIAARVRLDARGLSAVAWRRLRNSAARGSCLRRAGHRHGRAPAIPSVCLSQASSIIDHGADAPMDDFPGSIAPSVTEEAIQRALGRAYADWELLAAAAEYYARPLATEWSWENKNMPAIRRMIEEAEKHE